MMAQIIWGERRYFCRHTFCQFFQTVVISDSLYPVAGKESCVAVGYVDTVLSAHYGSYHYPIVVSEVQQIGRAHV